MLDELSGGIVEKLDSASAASVNASGLAKASPMGMGLYRIEPVGLVGSVRIAVCSNEAAKESFSFLTRSMTCVLIPQDATPTK